MSILSCILSKFNNQKKLFTQGDQVLPYEQVGQEQRDMLQRSGYITEDMVNNIQSRINQAMRNGLSESEAASKVHTEMSNETNDKAIKMMRTQDAVRRTISDINDARGRGASDKNIVDGIFRVNPGQDARYGGMIASGNRFDANVYAWKQRLASLLDPLVQKLPLSYKGMPSASDELLFAKTLWGQQVDDHSFSGAASSLKSFVDTAEKDLTTVGRTGYQNPETYKGIWSQGERIRSDLDKWEVMVNPETVDWSTLQNKFPGKFDTLEQQTNALKELKAKLTSEGLKQTDLGWNESDLSFKDPNDWLAYQQKYGYGSMLGVANKMLEHYSREYAIGKTFGGDIGAFRAGVLDYLHNTNESNYSELANTFDKNLSSRLFAQDGNAPTLIGTATNILKNAVVASNIGFAGVASLFHTIIGSIAAHAQGLNPVEIAGNTFKNAFKSVFTPESFRSLQGEIAKAQINADVALSALEKVGRNLRADPFTKLYNNAANTVVNLSGLTNMGYAAKLTQANIIRQTVADIISKGEPIDGNIDIFRRNSFSDLDSQKLKPYVYENTNYGTPVNELDLGKAYNSGDETTIDAAIKVHQMMDKANRALFPHGYSEAQKTMQQLRKVPYIGEPLANMITPLTGYTLGFWGDVIKPTIMNKGMAGFTGTAALASAIMTIGATQVQLRRVANGQNPLPFGTRLAVEAASTSSFGPLISQLYGTYSTAGHADSSILDSLPGMRPMKDIMNLGKNAIEAPLKGKETHFTRDGLKVFNDLVPGKSLPFVGLLYNHEFQEPLYQMLDPGGYQKSIASKKQNIAKEGSSYWWQPGETSPSESPKL